MTAPSDDDFLAEVMETVLAMAKDPAVPARWVGRCRAHWYVYQVKQAAGSLPKREPAAEEAR